MLEKHKHITDVVVIVMKTANMYISCCGNEVIVCKDAAALPAVGINLLPKKHFIFTPAEKRVIGNSIKQRN